jgi:ectoine hydroxylase-related dioxygenase (phytanoyl-CoA dioxygenase family)
LTCFAAKVHNAFVPTPASSPQNPAAEHAAQFHRDGFYIAPPSIPRDAIERVIPRMDAVMRGEYETGVAPLRAWNPTDSPTKIRKIDQAHLSDRAIFEFVTHPAIGRWAAALTGARMIQLWALQMLYKPAGGDTAGNIGWHQDRQYWTTWWTEDSEVFTAWVAVSDVRRESGPMIFVRGSHRWGFLNKGDFFGSNHDQQRAQIPVPSGEQWEEVAAVMPAGAMSFHHRLTYHGSGPNVSAAPRRSFALHLRTEKSKPLVGNSPHYDYVAHLDDPNVCPTLYQS